MRTFDTGATRDSDENKLDFDGFFSPDVLEAYANYMHKNRVQADGSLRASDNWQKGIPQEAYMKSMWRHFFAVWKGWRNGQLQDEELCALLFNVMGMLHERIKSRNPITASEILKMTAERDKQHADEALARARSPAAVKEAADIYNRIVPDTFQNKIAPGGALPNKPDNSFVLNMKEGYQPMPHAEFPPYG